MLAANCLNRFGNHDGFNIRILKRPAYRRFPEFTETLVRAVTVRPSILEGITTFFDFPMYFVIKADSLLGLNSYSKSDAGFSSASCVQAQSEASIEKHTKMISAFFILHFTTLKKFCIS